MSQEQLNNPYVIDLLEEGFIQANRAITDERRSYIASLVANGITEDDADVIKAKHALQILQELNDAEIIWLQYYSLNKVDKQTFEENISIS